MKTLTKLWLLTYKYYETNTSNVQKNQESLWTEVKLLFASLFQNEANNKQLDKEDTKQSNLTVNM